MGGALLVFFGLVGFTLSQAIYAAHYPHFDILVLLIDITAMCTILGGCGLLMAATWPKGRYRRSNPDETDDGSGAF